MLSVPDILDIGIVSITWTVIESDSLYTISMSVIKYSEVKLFISVGNGICRFILFHIISS